MIVFAASYLSAAMLNIGLVMQFFRNRRQNDIDESVDRLGKLFDIFLTTAVHVTD